MLLVKWHHVPILRNQCWARSSTYCRKISLLVAAFLNLFFFVLYWLLSGYEELYDQSLRHVAHDYSRHLELIFSKDFRFLSPAVWLAIILSLNFFMVLAAIPSVIKFGNWYAKILKLVYKEQEEEDKSRMPKRRGDEEEKSEKEQEADLRRQSQRVLWRLNVYLTSMLLLIVTSHRYFLQFLPLPYIDGLRLLFMAVSCYSVCSTMSSAIELNGALAYNYVVEYFKE